MQEMSKFEKRKEELFIEITELIKRDGLENLTVRYICQELDISTGSFYHYFPEKGDITRILFSGIDRYFEYEVLDLLGDDELENLVIFAEGYGTFIEMTGVEAANNISIAPFKNREKEYLTEERSIFKILLNIIERGKYKEQIKSNHTAMELARMIMITLRGYCSDWGKMDGSYNIVEEMSDYIILFVSAIKYEK